MEKKAETAICQGDNLFFDFILNIEKDTYFCNPLRENT